MDEVTKGILVLLSKSYPFSIREIEAVYETVKSLDKTRKVLEIAQSSSLAVEKIASFYNE